MRIAVGGLHHETNTFAPTKASFDLFERADSWPGLQRGPAMLEAMRGLNIPLSGFMETALAAGHALRPLVWANASPSAHTTEDAYERIVAIMLDELAAAGPIDALFLDLHGAMVTEHLEDGEGELLRRLRAAVGPDLPIVASLDLHANITRAMVENADALAVYRTYPHVDMAANGARSAALVERIVRDGRPAKAWRQIPFLIPLNWQCTLIEPARSIYQRLGELEAAAGPVFGVSFACGFPQADIADAGPSVVAYAADPATADRLAADVAGEIERRAREFSGRFWRPAEVVAEAKRLAETAAGPVVIADTQDNPGGGGNGDTTGMLRALVEGAAEGAVLGLLCDPPAAAAAHAAGERSVLDLALGGRSGIAGDGPYPARVRVERVGSGRFLATGPFYGGSMMDLGPMALLRIEGTGVRVAVSSRKVQAADQAMFTHLGVEPSAERILVLKSSVHFRADFQPIAAAILVAVAPGPVTADPRELPYRRLRPTVARSPEEHVRRN